jgi:hypothetical protein
VRGDRTALRQPLLLAVRATTSGRTISEDHVTASLRFASGYNAVQVSNQVCSFAIVGVLLRFPCAWCPRTSTCGRSCGINVVHAVVGVTGRALINAAVGTSALRRIGVYATSGDRSQSSGTDRAVVIVGRRPCSASLAVAKSLRGPRSPGPWGSATGKSGAPRPRRGAAGVCEAALHAG